MSDKKKSKEKTDDTPDVKPDADLPAKPVVKAKVATDWDSGKHSVVKLSMHTKNRVKHNGHNPFNVKAPNGVHAAADVYHGWGWHKHHYAKDVELTKEDYLAALKAAGKNQRHIAAIAPHFKPPQAKAKE